MAVICTMTWAQESKVRSADEEAEWVKIRNVKAVYEEAVSSNQIEKLRPYIARDFWGVLVTGAEARSFDGLMERNREIRALIGEGGTYSVKVNYEPGKMFGDLAEAHGTTDEKVVTGSGKEFVFTSRWLANLIREDGEWKLTRFSATMDPVNNAFARDTMWWTGAMFGGGGLLIGALAGFLLRGLRR